MALDKPNNMMFFPPSPILLPYVSHYWLGMNQTQQTYSALPDGAVDIVIQSNDSGAQSQIYGTTTSRTEIDIEPNHHYLGIRFKPGQSRHFINLSAQELTDNAANSKGILGFSLEEFSESIPMEGIAERLNNLFEAHLQRQQPESTALDQVIMLIQDSQGLLKIDEAVVYSGKSRRQFERIFKEAVGISPKFFSLITRFNHATKLITQISQTTLADIATDAGYSDQSHMNHDFKRLTGVSPGDFMRDFGAYLQNNKRQD